MQRLPWLQRNQLQEPTCPPWLQRKLVTRIDLFQTIQPIDTIEAHRRHSNREKNGPAQEKGQYQACSFSSIPPHGRSVSAQFA